MTKRVVVVSKRENKRGKVGQFFLELKNEQEKLISGRRAVCVGYADICIYFHGHAET